MDHTFEFTGSEGFKQEIAPARTFGYMKDVANMLGQHDMRPFETGPARKRYAEAYNQGRTKEQIDYNTMLYNRQHQQFEQQLKTRKQTQDEEQKTWEKTMQKYMAFKRVATRIRNEGALEQSGAVS